MKKLLGVGLGSRIMTRASLASDWHCQCKPTSQARKGNVPIGHVHTEFRVAALRAVVTVRVKRGRVKPWWWVIWGSGNVRAQRGGAN